MAPETAGKSSRPRQSILRRALRRWGSLGILLIVLAVIGWQRRGTGFAQGDKLEGDVSPAAAAQVRHDGHFRVGIYNIEGAVGKDDATIAHIGQIISDTDICGLAEVRPNSLSSRPNQARQIAETIGRAWLFAPAERRFWLDGVGNGVVSRLSAGPWVRLPLPNAGHSDINRNVIQLRVMVAQQPVNVLVTHIDRGPAHAEQIAAVTQLFQLFPPPVVLLADLNADPLQPEVQPLLATPGAQDAIAQFVGLKAQRVDWILARGCRVVNAGKTEDPASDHIFFWADLQLPPATTQPSTTQPTTRAAAVPASRESQP